MARIPKRNIWKIVLTSRGKVIKYLYYAASEEVIYDKFKIEKKKSDSVRFPVRYINIGKLVEADYEIYLIKKNEGGDDIARLKDRDGTIRQFKTNDEDWVIYDRESYDIEENFWVYGYHPIYQRKDFNWIFDNLFKKSKSKYDLIQVAAFKNKLLIKRNSILNMVLCKNVSDCFRLYNELERECNNNKRKNVIFIGDVYVGKVKKYWRDKIKELTNWNNKKILRSSLRP